MFGYLLFLFETLIEDYCRVDFKSLWWRKSVECDECKCNACENGVQSKAFVHKTYLIVRRWDRRSPASWTSRCWRCRNMTSHLYYQSQYMLCGLLCMHTDTFCITLRVKMSPNPVQYFKDLRITLAAAAAAWADVAYDPISQPHIRLKHQCHQCFGPGDVGWQFRRRRGTLWLCAICTLTFGSVSESGWAPLPDAHADHHHHECRHGYVRNEGQREQSGVQLITVLTHWRTKDRAQWGQLAQMAHHERLWFLLTLSLYIEVIFFSVVFTAVKAFLVIFILEFICQSLTDVFVFVVPRPLFWTGHCARFPPEWHSSLKHMNRC